MIIDTDTIQPALPRGRCYCGCGEETTSKQVFVNTHDHPALSAVVSKVYGDTATFLAAHGYGPDTTPLTAVGELGETLKRGDRVVGKIKNESVTATILAVRKGHLLLQVENDERPRSGKAKNFRLCP